MNDEHRQLILTCLKHYGTGDLDALAPLLCEDYVDHGLPFQTTTRDAWLALARELPLTDLRIDIRALLTEGDTVTMFSRRWLPGGELDIAVADLFRIRDGRLAERWEVVEPIADTGPDPLATL